MVQNIYKSKRKVKKSKAVPKSSTLGYLCPELVSVWDFEKNKDKTPDNIASNSCDYYHWKYIRRDGTEVKRIMRPFDVVLYFSRVKKRNQEKGIYVLDYDEIFNYEYNNSANTQKINPSDVIPVEKALTEEGKKERVEKYKKQLDEFDKEQNKRVLDAFVEKTNKKAIEKEMLQKEWKLKQKQEEYSDKLKISILTTHPDLIKEWHPFKNGKLNPIDVTEDYAEPIWWSSPYEKGSKKYSIEWCATIRDRLDNMNYSEYMLQRTHKAYIGLNDLSTTHPNLAKEWNKSMNDPLRITDYTAKSEAEVWWDTPYTDIATNELKIITWRASIKDRVSGRLNPYNSHVVNVSLNDLTATHPNLVKEWHPTLNKGLYPNHVKAGSAKKVFWTCKEGHVWNASIASRTKLGCGCPYCSGSKMEKFSRNYYGVRQIPFEINYSFKSSEEPKIRYFKYDLYLYMNRLAVELDGKQHFEQIFPFYEDTEKGKKEFQKRISNDNLKNTYCLKINVPLLRIPYIFNPDEDYEIIEEFLETFLKTRKIPQVLIDYYEKYDFSNYSEIAKQMNELPTELPAEMGNQKV